MTARPIAGPRSRTADIRRFQQAVNARKRTASSGKRPTLDREDSQGPTYFGESGLPMQPSSPAPTFATRVRRVLFTR
jgi:hypothetical protein